MTDGIIPLGDFEPRCSQCGAQLKVEYDGVEVQGENRLLCSDHGDQGSVQEFRDKIGDQARDGVTNAVRDMLKPAEFNPE